MDYSSNIEKWQACSHPDLANKEPEDLFTDEFAQKYHELHDDIWDRITRLHGTIHTLEQIERFPFNHLYAPNGKEFWHLVIENFADMAVVLLHGLVNDSSSDAHTIRSFKNECMRAPWQKQEIAQLLKKTLREREFDATHEVIMNRIKNIRHVYLAHRLIDSLTGLPMHSVETVSLSELRALFDAVHALFGALSFGTACCTLAGDLMPATVGGKPVRSCLDGVLDAVLRDSYFVNQPERYSFWKDVRSHTSDEHIRVMNELRARIGLPEA